VHHSAPRPRDRLRTFGSRLSASGGLARRLAYNTAHAASGRFASLLLWVVFTPMVLHTLGGEGYAVWSLFFALTGYFTALDFGLAQGTLKHVAAARERGDAATGGAFATLAALGYVLLAILWLVLTLLFRDALLDWLRVPAAARPATAFAMIAGSAVFACSGLSNVMTAVLQGSGRFDLGNFVLLTVVGFQAVGVPTVIRLGLGLRGLVVTVGAAWGASALLGLFMIARAEPSFRWQRPGEALAHLREAIGFGGPLQVTNLFAVLHSQIDKFLLARFVALAAVTPYDLGFRVIVAAAAAPQVLVLALMPAAAALHAAEHHERLRDLYRRANRYVLSVSSITMAPILGSAGRIYDVWLGPGHADAAHALRGLTLAAMASIATLVGVSVARGVGRTDLEAWFAVVAFVVHLVLSVILLPRIGLTGALIAITVANLIAAAVFLSILTRTLGWRPTPILMEPLGIPALAVALGAAASFGLDRVLPTSHGLAGWLGLIAIAVLGAGIAAATVLVTGFVRWSETWTILMARGARGAS
jgi:O-antigen/teichoic acid export membrane protein